jgi:hypothetical protein
MYQWYVRAGSFAMRFLRTKKDMHLFIHNPVLLAGIKNTRYSRRPPAAAC